MTRRCFLKCLQNSHPPINLPHQQETVIGRSKLTKIKDQSCSRQQVGLIADCDNCKVVVKQLGENPSGLDGFALKKTGYYIVEHGSRVEILLNSYVHIIEFEPPPKSYDDHKSCKIKYEEGETNQSKRKKVIKAEEKVELSLNKTMEDVWENIDNGQLYIYTTKGMQATNRIAAFDMDGTLIKTKSGKVHPVDTNDWQLAFPNVPDILKSFVADKYKVIILSNQASIGNGRVKIEEFKKKIISLAKMLDVPLQVYIATGKSLYRKPATGMWKVLSEQKNDGLMIDMDKSFYCGDAAGRKANWAPGRKKDHSMADKLLAENLGLKFYTPEQYFLGHCITNVPMSKPEFNPKELTSEPFNDSLISPEKEILVLVGYPGSGKSFLAKQIEQKTMHQYVAVCRDVLGSWQKCASKATDLLKQGHSVIVDSTNPDVDSRARWTSLANEMKVQCRCVKMATSMAHAQHNNKFRELTKISHMPVNDIVFHTYKNKFSEPISSEGFKEVINVKFNPHFEDEEMEKIYRMHLLEK